jgi:hypothetical protein
VNTIFFRNIYTSSWPKRPHANLHFREILISRKASRFQYWPMTYWYIYITFKWPMFTAYNSPDYFQFYGLFREPFSTTAQENWTIRSAYFIKQRGLRLELHNYSKPLLSKLQLACIVIWKIKNAVNIWVKTLKDTRNLGMQMSHLSVQTNLRQFRQTYITTFKISLLSTNKCSLL